MTTYAEAAASISKTPITLATITLNWPDEQVIRVATTGYTDASGNYYEALIQAAPTITTKVSDPFGGKASQSMASLGLANTGALDAYREYSWVGASIVVEFGFAEIADADFKTMFTGYVSGAADTETTLTLSVQSAAEKLKQTIIPPDEYADMSLPDRVEWILGLAGLTKDTDSFTAWESDNDYATRFHTNNEMTAETALTGLLFGSIWGVNTEGKFFVHSVSEAAGDADAELGEVEVLSVSRKALSQYYRVSATIPDVDAENRANLLPSASKPYLLSVVDQVRAVASSELGHRRTYSSLDAYYDRPCDLNVYGQSNPTESCVNIFTDSGYWTPGKSNSVFCGNNVALNTKGWSGDTWIAGDLRVRVRSTDEIESVAIYYGLDPEDGPVSDSSPARLWGTFAASAFTLTNAATDYFPYNTYTAPLPGLSRWPTWTWADVRFVQDLSVPHSLDIVMDEETTVDLWGIYASGISSIALQYWDDITESYITAGSQTGETTICTGAVTWFALSPAATATKWRISVITADTDCKIYRVKFCDTTQNIETITKELSSVLTANPLAKASATTRTYIKAVDEAEDAIERAMSLRSASRTVTTITTRAMPGLRSIYDVVSLETERIDNALYRVVGITEKLATGETTLELFK